MRKNLSKHLILWALVGATLGISGCFSAEAEDPNNDQADTVAVPVEVAELVIGDISSNYQTTAVLEAKEEAFVVARASGIIQDIFVDEGDFVTKGQALATLEKERYELNLLRAEADLLGIKKELDKIDKVYTQQLVSDDTFDKLTAQYQSAKANLELAKLDLKETTIVAPIAGFIAERNAKVGNLTESFQRERMFHVIQQQQLYGIVYLPEKELPRVHIGQQATLAIGAANNQSVIAEVVRISPVIDPETGTFKVTLGVANDDNTLKAGMFARVNINYDTHQNAVLVPRRALLYIDDQINVFVVSGATATKVEVSIGYQEGEFVEVLQGLAGEEQVIVTGHQNLKDQAPVTIVNS